MNRHALTIAAFLGGLLVTPAASSFVLINQDTPDGQLGTLSRPASAGKIEFETADDFTTTAAATALTNATFTGLITGVVSIPSSISEVAVEIYRIFPKDSNTARTPQVPSRANSPSDVEFDNTGRTSLPGGGLTFSTTILNPSLTVPLSVANIVTPCAVPLCAGAGGSITGTEVRFNVTFTNPIFLPADHYFFVPQVEIPALGSDFFLLSAAKPIGPPVDLQSWIRSDATDPDWLRIATDLTGITAQSPTGFNAAFSLTAVVPEPGSVLLVALGFVFFWRSQRKAAAFTRAI